MRRARFFVLASVLAGLAQLTVPGAQAQAPGGGRGHLIDKHAAKGVSCGQCHAQGASKPPSTETCLACHGRTYEKLAAMTGNDRPNPHSSHRGEVDCAECHHVHKASVTSCNQCHTFNLISP